MAKLSKITQPIFAGSAPQTDTSVFGTMKSSPQYTTDIASSINTQAFEEGWKAAIEMDYAPFIEDMNTLQRAITYQIAYIQQQGLPEWDGGTEYYLGSLAKLNTVNGCQIYSSLTNNNVGNLLSDTIHWKLIFDTNSDLWANVSLSNLNEAGQAVLNAKQNTITGAASTIASDNLTENRALVSNSSGKVGVSNVTNTELGYLSGASSNIQNQINTKANTSMFQVVSSLPANPDSNVFYFIPE